MGIPTSGTIKMMGAGTNSIAQEKAGTTGATPSAVQNVSLKGLSVDNIADFQYIGGAAVDIAVAGSTPDQQAPHGMKEFYGYTHTNLEDFPSITSWGTTQRTTVSSAGFMQAYAVCSMYFTNDTVNKKILISWYGNRSTDSSVTVYTGEMDYTGYTGSISVKYNHSQTPSETAISNYPSQYPPYGWPGSIRNTNTNSNSSGSLKLVNTNYTIPTSGSIDFRWKAGTYGSSYTNDENLIWHTGVSFTISFVSSGVTYSKTSSTKNINLVATKGTGVF